MFQIGENTIVSLDLAEEFFCCDLDKCHGECCIEGDAGAPITSEEDERLREVLPKVWDELLPAGQHEIEERGVSYTDEDGDLVTSIVDGRNCVFTCYGPGGLCQCALERAFRRGETTWRKPASCYLYPVRITEYKNFTAVNYHRWSVCRDAVKLGRKLGIRLYQFLKEPLTERFGREWYDELCATCEAYLAEKAAEARTNQPE